MSRRNSTMEAKRAALSRPNEYKAAELLQWAAAQKPRTGGFFFAKPSPNTIARRNIEARYESRSNVCPSCFMTKSTKGGHCGC